MPTVTHPPAPQALAAHGLWLRPWQAADADALLEAVLESTSTVGRWLPWCREGYSRDDALAWINQCQSGWERGEAYVFGIFDGDGAVLGDIGLNRLDRRNRHANLGYWVRERAQGQGTAPTAVRIAAAFGFDVVGLVRIEIVVAIDNQPSRRCAEKAGARYEGEARQRLIVTAVPLDAAIYSLIPGDLAQPAAEQSAAMS